MYVGRFASSHVPLHRGTFCDHLLTNNQNVLSTNFWTGINIPAENRQRLSGPGKQLLSRKRCGLRKATAEVVLSSV